jgi:hypothetical protein
MVTWERVKNAVYWSAVCACGDEKMLGHPFCRGCWFRLPEKFRQSLIGALRSRRIGCERKRVIYWRCLVNLGLTVKTAEQFQPDETKEENPCSDWA